MTDDLLAQLATHRRTLAHLLGERAKFSAGFVPAHLANGIADARAAIAQLKAQLRAAAIAVDDEPNDEATPAETAAAAAPPMALGSITVANYGDHVAGDSFIGDKIMGNKYETYYTVPPSVARFSAPYPNPDQPLIGRESLLAECRARLCQAAPTRLALDGMPGVGKTRIALALAYDPDILAHFTGGVLMASLGQQPTLSAVPRQWAIDIGFALDPHWPLDEQLQRIVAQFTQVGKPFLIIIDDVWSIADAQPFLLASPALSLLFTGRQRDQLHSTDLGDLVGPANRITIPSLADALAIELLRQTAEIPAPAYGDELATLAALVGDLPLLLCAMGRYLYGQRQQSQNTWFEAALTDLHDTARRLNLPVATIQQARTNHRGGLLGMFRRKPVTALTPRLIIELSLTALPRSARDAFVRLAALPPDPLTFGEDSARAVAQIDAPSLNMLLQRNLLTEAGAGRFRLHRALWDFAEARDPRAVRDARRHLADWHARLSHPDYADEFGSWRLNPDNWQHMLQTWHAAIDDPEALRNAITTILPLLIDQGYARDVLPGLLHAEATFRKLKSELALTANIRYHLGHAYRDLVDYTAARTVLLAALDGFQALRSENGQAATFALLGLVEEANVNYTEARNYFQRALDLTPETDERSYAACLNNLAFLLQAQGDYAAARPLYERALQVAEQALGPAHPSTANSLNNLAFLLQAQGDYAAARPLYERALTIYEQALGPAHPDTARSLNNLAFLLQAQGDYAAARPLYERALTIYEQALGPAHPDTARSLNNLAFLLQAQGDYAAARPLYERALAIREAALGLEHPDSQRVRANLAALNAQSQNPE